MPLPVGDSATFYRRRRNGAIIVAESPTAQNAPERPNKKRQTIPKNRIFAAVFERMRRCLGKAGILLSPIVGNGMVQRQTT